MYRKYSLDELVQTKTKFFVGLQQLIKQEKTETLKKLLQQIVKTGHRAYYFERGYPTFSFTIESGGRVHIFDEKERIELVVSGERLDKLHSIVKDERKIKKQKKIGQKTQDILWGQFKVKEIPLPNNKPYIVYDIETNLVGKDLEKAKFYLGYAYIVTENGQGMYRYIDESNLEKFVRYMLDFDGYIVGYNNMYFDNPVSVYNIPDRNYTMIEKINAKSLDLFQFYRNLTGKRIGLNKLANALAGITKTLSSGAEGEELMKQYKETGDESYLNTFKKYCKNDVEMTVLVFFYFLTNDSLEIESEEFMYTQDSFISLAQTMKGAEKDSDQGIFD